MPEKKGIDNMKNRSVRTIAAIGIGSALFFVVGRFVTIPSPVPNTSILIQYGLLAFMATMFSPVAVALIGLAGHALIDLSIGRGIWWSGIIASACFGLIMGLLSRKINLANGEFGRTDSARFNLFQIISHIIAWGVIAPVLDIVMYAEPANKVFLQGFISGIANIVTTAIIGTLLCIAYASTRPKKSSSGEE